MANDIPGYYAHKRPEIVAIVEPQGKRVLDIGCAAGAMGAAMLEAGAAEVVGVEVVADAAQRARKQLTATYQLDLETFTSLPYPDGYFDVITFADVLEHVRDPAAVLTKLRRYLRDGGRIVCSIPNVRHESVLFPLLFNGTFEYQDAGILDRTHLRFFTRVEIERLMRDTGFAMVGPLRVARTPASKLVGVMADLVRSGGGDAARFVDEATAVQFVFSAEPTTAQGAREAEVPNLWITSRHRERILVVPQGDAWERTLESVVDRYAGSADLTLAIPLTSDSLQQPPEALARIIGERVDAVLIEAPSDDDGWERLVAGATAVVVGDGQSDLATLAQRTGTERVELHR